jgi:hypothetical protein
MSFEIIERVWGNEKYFRNDYTNTEYLCHILGYMNQCQNFQVIIIIIIIIILFIVRCYLCLYVVLFL